MPLLDSLLTNKTPAIVKSLGVRTTTGSDGIPTLESHETSQIKTLDELLQAAGVDREKWEVERHTANVWHQMSTENGLVPLHQVTAKLRLRDLSPTNIREILETGWSAFSKGLAAPFLPKTPAAAKGHMTLFAVPDLHLGKLAWSEETGGGNWDLKIAQAVFEEAIEDLIARSPVTEEAWFICGNDFYNVDSEASTTTNGTPQDEDGRWQKTFIVGQKLILWAVGRLRKKFPIVRVIMIGGNHDRQRAFYLGELLSTAFAKTKGVVVDNRPLSRKYYAWGDTGFGFAHGDSVKTKDLPGLCQNEAREIWGRTKRFELCLGHLHQDLVKILGGVIIRWLPSLCAPDAWHGRMGYTLAEKAAMTLSYDQRGMQSIRMHYPRPELFL